MELKVKMTMSSRIRHLIPHEHQEFLLPVLSMFVGYICHDALQERMFRFPGFEFGWFMTVVEVSTMLIGGLLLNNEFVRPKRSAIFASALTGLCISTSHGCGNTALLYSTYPLKVAFKSCKLIPTMWLGVFITKRSFPWNQYLAAMIMCVGLVILTLADWKPRSLLVEEPKFPFWIGPVLLAISTTLDSIVPNLQERLFATAQCSTSDAMFLCNSCMFLISLSYTLITGELPLALDYCYHNPHTLLVLLAQALAAYLGLQGYLTIVSRIGGVAAVLLANARKLITIVFSFLLFAKPCTKQHILGLACMIGGVYLGVAAKERKRKEAVGKKLDSEGLDSSASTTSAAVATADDATTAITAKHHSNELV